VEFWRVMTLVATPSADLFAAAQAALAEGDWALARARLRRALEAGGEGLDVPAAWDGLADASWWLYDGEATIAARQSAYEAHLAADDPRCAGRAAAWLACDHRETRGDVGAGEAWLARAHALLDPLPPGPEHGWLALHEGTFVLGAGLADAAAAYGERAAAIGREHGDGDLETIGLAQSGAALVAQGLAGRGLARFDEAGALIDAGRTSRPIWTGWALAYLSWSSAAAGDFRRATVWAEAMRALAERWNGRQMLGVCRTTLGQVLTASGAWAEADRELTGALADLEAARPELTAAALVHLAALRVRQGRPAEAGELSMKAGPHPDAVIGRGALALERGDAMGARAAAWRVLRRLPAAAVLDRLPALELTTRASARLGDADAARAALAEATRIAERAGTPYLLARAAALGAELHLALGDAEAARRAAEDAVAAFTTAAAPYDAAAARLTLTAALRALDRPDEAAAQAGDALASLARLRVPEPAGETPRAAFPAPSGTGDAQGDNTAGLTPREREILRLIAQGLPDAQIARRLVVSPHTVHRHVANIRQKLRLPSRAAAVAYATQAGVL
jgi:DNA-binding CsgD family transcriptional regulator